MLNIIWLIPLLPLLGAAINGLLGGRLRFSEKTVAVVAVGPVALAFLLSLGAVVSYSNIHPEPYIIGFKYEWIPGGATEITLGQGQNTNALQEKKNSDLSIEWSYQLDPLSSVFILIITGVGLCIFVFAVGYMHGDAGFYRFFAYLDLFMFMMLVLVMGSNFLMMFVGWEGVGLCSYLLIGYHFNKQEAANASRKAFITNRIGDFGFILGIFAIIATFGSASYLNVFEQARVYPVEQLWSWGIMSWIAFALFIGAVGKSAQIPLYVWLPDAMAGPTPVSALIHAATMVTAGLYMLVRCNIIFQHSRTVMFIVAVVGAFTALLAATIAITQNDIKKVLAYSTVSQLGLMVLACGVGAFAAAIFHVLTHAFFKALLFLGAGSVIHDLHGEQNLWHMGGLKKHMPKTYRTMLVGWLAICGVFPLSGFWSKDEILWETFSTNIIPYGWLLWTIAIIVAFCTAFYMTRLFVLTFHGEERFSPKSLRKIPDSKFQIPNSEDDSIQIPNSKFQIPNSEDDSIQSPKSEDKAIQNPKSKIQNPLMWIPLVVLAFFASISGLIGISPALTGGHHVGGNLNIVNWLEPVIQNDEAVQSQSGILNFESGIKRSVDSPNPEAHSSTELLFMFISLVVSGLGIGLGWFVYAKKPSLADAWSVRLGPVYRASLNKYWIDELYGFLFTRRTMDAARGVYAIDSKIVDGGVNGAARLTQIASRLTGGSDKYFIDGLVNTIADFITRLAAPVIRAAQTGLTQTYALLMVIGLLIAVALIYGKDILTGFFAVSGK